MKKTRKHNKKYKGGMIVNKKPDNSWITPKL